MSTPRNLGFADIGAQVAVSYNGFVNELLTPGLAAHTLFTLQSVSDGNQRWTFSYLVGNDFTAPVTSARVSVFGFDVSGTTADNRVIQLGSATATGAYNRVNRNGNIPQIGPTVGVCFRAGGGGNTCASGGGGGNSVAGSSLSGSFSLVFGEAVNRLTLNHFVVRYQSINSANIRGGSGVGVSVPDLPSEGGGSEAGVVPEPAVWAQLIAGFGLVGALLRRRRGLVPA